MKVSCLPKNDEKINIYGSRKIINVIYFNSKIKRFLDDPVFVLFNYLTVNKKIRMCPTDWSSWISSKELSFYHKLLFSNPYIFATRCRRSLIFQNRNYERSNNLPKFEISDYRFQFVDLADSLSLKSGRFLNFFSLKLNWMKNPQYWIRKSSNFLLTVWVWYFLKQQWLHSVKNITGLPVSKIRHLTAFVGFFYFLQEVI